MTLDLVILIRDNNFEKSKLKFNNKSYFGNLLRNFCKYNFENVLIFHEGKSKELCQIYNKKNINFVNIRCFDLLNTKTPLKLLSDIQRKTKNNFVIINSKSIINFKPNNIFKKKSKINIMKKNIDGSLIIKRNHLNFKKIDKKILKIIISKLSHINSLITLKKKCKPQIHNAKPAIFLDRDGVINYDTGYVHKWSKFKFMPGVLKGLKLINKKNYLTFIVTNQSGIARGIFTEKKFLFLHQKIKTYLSKKKIYFDDVQYSPYHPKGKVLRYKKRSLTRKPGNLMIKKIFDNFFINKKKSFMLGDKKSDEIAAKKSGLKFYYSKPNFYSQIKEINFLN